MKTLYFTIFLISNIVVAGSVGTHYSEIDLHGAATLEMKTTGGGRAATHSGADVVKTYTLTIAADNGTVCLLYTSPSPRDRTRSRMPSSA